MKQIDGIERRIVNLLQRHGRLPISRLAIEADISRSAASQRLFRGFARSAEENGS